MMMKARPQDGPGAEPVHRQNTRDGVGAEEKEAQEEVGEQEGAR